MPRSSTSSSSSLSTSLSSTNNSGESDDSSTIGERDTLGSQCVNCQEDIPGMGIECAHPSCVKVRVRLCLECFALGAEIGPHVSDHKYRYFHSGRCPPVLPEPQTPGPSASSSRTSIISTRAASTEGAVWYEEEQIRLLRGLELYGYGNWSEIANYIATKTAQEAKEEYNRRYINGPLGRITWSEENMAKRPVPFPIDHTIRPVHLTGTEDSEEEEAEENDNDAKSAGNPNSKIIDSDDDSDDAENDESSQVSPKKKKKETVKVQKVVVGPLSPSLTSKLPPLDITREEMRLLGCMPKRDDYEKEYDNEAEKLVSNISFEPDDTELDVSMKLAVIDIYTRKLRERARRKKMVREHQLVREFFGKPYKKEQVGVEEPQPSTSKAAATGKRKLLPPFPLPEGVTPKEHLAQYRYSVEKAFRPFAQFVTKTDYDNLTNNLVMARNLCFRIQALQNYRRLGLKTMAEVEEYEREQQKAEVAKRKEKEKLEALAESSEDEEGGGDGGGGRTARRNEDDEDYVEEEEEDEEEEDELEDEAVEEDEDDDDDDDFELSFNSGDSPSSGSTLSSELLQRKSHSATKRKSGAAAKRGRASSTTRRTLTRRSLEPRKRKPKTKRFHRPKSHTPSALERQRQAKEKKEKEKREKAQEEDEDDEEEDEEEVAEPDLEEDDSPIKKTRGRRKKAVPLSPSSSESLPPLKNRKTMGASTPRAASTRKRTASRKTR